MTMPFGFEAWLGTMLMNARPPERSVEWCRRLLARGADPYALAGQRLVLGLMSGQFSRGRDGCREGSDRSRRGTSRIPYALSFALLTYGMAFCDADPAGRATPCAVDWRLLKTAVTAGPKPHLANVLGRLEAEYGDPLAALDYLTLAMRNYHDSGNLSVIRIPLAVLAGCFDRLGRDEPACHHRRFRGQSRYHRVVPGARHSDLPPTRCPRRPDLRIARPQGRDDDHRRNGDLRTTTKSTRPEQN